MLLKVTHETIYLYPSDARDSHNELRLAPLSDESQTSRWHRIDVDPGAMVDSFMGPGGIIHTFNIRRPHRRLAITMTATVETHRQNPFTQLDGEMGDWDWYEPEKMNRLHAERLSASRYVRLSPEARDLAHEVRASAEGPVQFIQGVQEKVYSLLAYDRDVTHVHTDSDEALALGQGVCQDFAHVMLAIIRSAGIPCQYVSGYLYNGENEHLRGDQAMHAWVDCLLPNGKWMGVDPTNNILANDHHIRVHVGCDYSEVTPTRGIYWGSVSAPPVVKVQVTQSAEELRPSWGGLVSPSWPGQPGLQWG